MVRITNGVRTTMVTRGAFEEYYKPHGWKTCDGESESKIEAVEEAAVEEPTIEENPEEEVEEEATVEETLEPEEIEIPISEMKVDELKAYAKEHNIDISAAKNKDEIKDIIKAEIGG